MPCHHSFRTFNGVATQGSEPHLQRRLLLLALVQRPHDLAPLRPHPDRGHEEASEAVRNFAAGHQERVSGVLVHRVAFTGHARLIDGQGVAGHEHAVRRNLRTVRTWSVTFMDKKLLQLIRCFVVLRMPALPRARATETTQCRRTVAMINLTAAFITCQSPLLGQATCLAEVRTTWIHQLA